MIHLDDIIQILYALLMRGTQCRRYELVFKAGLITGAAWVGLISLLIILYLL